jgi:uncharacterized membrane protein
MRRVVFIAGILLLLLGLLWIGQGTGYFPYPSSSFMISNIGWAYRGAAVAVSGIIVMVLSRKIGR